MKYTLHGFSQRVAIELGLDNDDLALLRWFVDFSSAGMKKYQIGDSIYYWVNYQTVCEELPIVASKKDVIYRRLKKMSDAKVLKHETLKQGGTYSLYGFDSKYRTLISDTNGGTGGNPEVIQIQPPNVCVDTLHQKICEAVGEVSKKAIFELLKKNDPDIIEKYIADWDKYKPYVTKSAYGYFKKCVECQIPAQEQKTKCIESKKPQYANFEQREYTEEDFEKYYAKLDD
jgi:hypothetical protein